MKAQEIGVKPKVNVVLEGDNQMLDEVMIVAYGTAKKSAFTGSAATIKSEKITSRQTSNVTNALSGQVAGVQQRVVVDSRVKMQRSGFVVSDLFLPAINLYM